LYFLSTQGADSCEVVSFCGLLNRAEKKWTEWTESGRKHGVIFRRGTDLRGQKYFMKVDKSGQKHCVIFRRGTDLRGHIKKWTKVDRSGQTLL